MTLDDIITLIGIKSQELEKAISNKLETISNFDKMISDIELELQILYELRDQNLES